TRPIFRSSDFPSLPPERPPPAGLRGALRESVWKGNRICTSEGDPDIETNLRPRSSPLVISSLDKFDTTRSSTRRSSRLSVPTRLPPASRSPPRELLYQSHQIHSFPPFTHSPLDRAARGEPATAGEATATRGIVIKATSADIPRTALCRIYSIVSRQTLAGLLRKHAVRHTGGDPGGWNRLLSPLHARRLHLSTACDGFGGSAARQGLGETSISRALPDLHARNAKDRYTVTQLEEGYRNGQGERDWRTTTASQKDLATSPLRHRTFSPISRVSEFVKFRQSLRSTRSNSG
ncbi:hypothetical protein JCM5350_007008, partial [Sporobolomyces pararoseus]